MIYFFEVDFFIFFRYTVFSERTVLRILLQSGCMLILSVSVLILGFPVLKTDFSHCNHI